MAQKKANYISESSNALLEKFINQLMLDGKKNIARTIMDDAFEIIRKQNKNPQQIFEKAIDKVKPVIEVRPKRVGGAVYQVPIEVKAKRGLALSIRWLIQECRKKKSTTMANKLAQELLNAAAEAGGAYKKRVDVQKMAEANKAFAHFARY